MCAPTWGDVVGDEELLNIRALTNRIGAAFLASMVASRLVWPWQGIG